MNQGFWLLEFLSDLCRKPFHVLNRVIWLIKLCLTYSAGFWPLHLVRKPQLVSAQARWVQEDDTSHLLAWPSHHPLETCLHTNWPPFCVRVMLGSRLRHFWNSRLMQGVQWISSVSEKMLGSYHTKWLVFIQISSPSWLVPQLVPALEGRWASSNSISCVLNRLRLFLNPSEWPLTTVALIPKQQWTWPAEII